MNHPTPTSNAVPTGSETAWLRLFVSLTRNGHLLGDLLDQAAAADGLTGGESVLLAGVAEHAPECRQAELVRWLGHSPALVSGVVERLRSKGLLSGQRLAGDRRCQCWAMTPAGQEVLTRVRERWRELLSSTYPGVEAAPVLAALEALRKQPRDERILEIPPNRPAGRISA